jgi:Holliday junction resolvase RusA-like endonuclease
MMPPRMRLGTPYMKTPILLLEFEVQGQLRRKSNSRRIVTGEDGNTRVIKSEEALSYADDFARQITGDMKLGVGGKDQHLRMDVVVYYTSFKPDLSVELLEDLMQETGIISNDRWIREIHAYAAIDKKNPRVRVRLYELPSCGLIPF